MPYFVRLVAAGLVIAASCGGIWWLVIAWLDWSVPRILGGLVLVGVLLSTRDRLLRLLGFAVNEPEEEDDEDGDEEPPPERNGYHHNNGYHRN